MKSKEFPPVSEALLKELKAAFPDSVLGIQTEKGLAMRQGQQSVILHLQMQFNKQNPSLKE